MNQPLLAPLSKITMPLIMTLIMGLGIAGLGLALAVTQPAAAHPAAQDHDHHQGHDHHSGHKHGHDHHSDHEHNNDHGHNNEHEHNHEHEPADSMDHRHADPLSEAAQDEVWTCPMHPQVRRDGPGSCPICGMDLVRAEHEGHEPDQLHVPASVQQQMNIRTTQVQRADLPRRVHSVGRLEYDPSGLHHIHTRVEGWIESVGVHAIGDRVEAGDLLFTLYAPELVNAQEELLQALSRDNQIQIRSSRDRLRALGMQQQAIEQLEQQREVQREVPWRAGRDGVVTDLAIRHGMFAAPGKLLLEIADLSTLWLRADVFDRQAAWVAPGQHAEVRLSYAPGQVQHAAVSHIYPALDTVTRTVQLRIPLDNDGERLKPGMWADVRIDAEPLRDALLVPREALIRTGQETRIVLREDALHFRIRTVETGAISGDQVQILSGLDAGDEVVVSGQFLLDSEAALRAGHDRLDAHAHH